MEDYAAKMVGKTDAELRQYVERRAEYREQAVLAAMAELERRGQAVAAAAAIRAEVQASLRRAEAELVRNPAPVPEWMNRPSETEEEQEAEEIATNAPALYSPITVIIFSVFSFLIGGILMLLNLLKLRRYGGAALLVALVALSIRVIVWVSTSTWLNLQPQSMAMVLNVLLALLYVYVLWPSFIGKQPYKPRSWLAPIIVIFAVNLLFLLLYWAGISVPRLGQ